MENAMSHAEVHAFQRVQTRRLELHVNYHVKKVVIVRKATLMLKIAALSLQVVHVRRERIFIMYGT